MWKVDVGRISVGAAGAASVEWGPASSPVIWDGLVIVQVGTHDDSFLLALSAETGEQVWKTERYEIPFVEHAQCRHHSERRRSSS